MRLRLLLLLLCLMAVTHIALGSDRYVVDVESRLNVRDLSGEITWKLNNRDTVEMMHDYGDRCYVKFSDTKGYERRGYVVSKYLKKVENRQEQLAEAEPLYSSPSWNLYDLLFFFVPDDLSLGGWWWVIIGIYVWVKCKQGYTIAWAILHLPDRLFYWLNQLQFYLQKPWRFLLHDPGDTLMWMHKHYFWVVPTIAMYVLSTPLRYINALYFNLVDRTIHALFDSLGELFHPTDHDMDITYGWDYTWRWIVGFPLRLIYYAVRLMLAVFEGIVCTLFDTIVPTLTLYHGTTPYAAQRITEANNWQVGGGAYAGYGIYFGAQMRTARNYADGVVVVSRVTLGWIENLNLHYYMRTLPATCGNKGHALTQWAQDNHFTTIEWWREDRRWWEYCMVDHSYDYDNPWRIRPMYVITDDGSSKHYRIDGCVRLWFIPWLLKMIGKMLDE